MKASKLIAELRALKKRYGDKQVNTIAEWGRCPTTIVAAYDEDGRGEQDPGFKGVSQFQIH